MASQEQNKIKRLELENFTCFGKVEMDFSPGINLFIGENGTGKTHLLKVMFMVTNQKLNENYLASKSPVLEKDGRKLKLETGPSEVLIENYFPPSVKAWELIRTVPNAHSAKIEIVKNEQTLMLEADKISIKQYEHFKGILDFGFQHSSVFIPPQEMFSWFEGFAALYETVQNTFDPTYYFLAKSLSRPYPKGRGFERAKELVSDVENAIGGEVRLETNGKFYFYFNDGNNFTSAQVPTGINKLGQLVQLTLNGSIYPGSILFWDEPETGLNPKYITLVTKFLVTLANAGCQIFVSTHDYLLTHQLSLLAENREMEENVPPMRFFALSKGENGTEVEVADTVAEIQNNAILDEYAAYHELQMELAAKRFQTT